MMLLNLLSLPPEETGDRFDHALTCETRYTSNEGILDKWLEMIRQFEGDDDAISENSDDIPQTVDESDDGETCGLVSSVPGMAPLNTRTVTKMYCDTCDILFLYTREA